MQASSWLDNSVDGKDANENAIPANSQTTATPAGSRQIPGSDKAFMKYMRPVGPPGFGSNIGYMGNRPTCGGQCSLPHPRHPGHYPMYYPGHVPMMPVYYPQGPHGPVGQHGSPRLPPHMMYPYRHPHMGYVPVPPYPGYYPYPGSRFGSPGSAIPSTHSWNEYQRAMQKSAPNRSPVTFSRGHSPRCSEQVKQPRLSSQKGKARKSDKVQDTSFGSDSPFSDDDFGGPLTEEESKRRSKYRTLLRELAVNEDPVPVFNSTVKPQTLRQAICMYIDFLTVLNEGRVRVQEFNTAPLMEPGFEYEDYYHEALNEDVHFPSSMFKNWLAGYGVSIEVTDDPDGNDPGEKIVVITNLGNPKSTMGNPSSHQNMTNNNIQHMEKPSLIGTADNYNLQQEPSAAQNDDSYTGATDPSVQDPFSVVNKLTETIDEGCVITLIEDDEDSQGTSEAQFGSASGLENAYVGGPESGIPKQGSGKSRTTKRKSRYDSPETYVINNYLPPRKSCVDKRGDKGKGKAPTTVRRRSKTSTPVHDDYQHHQFMNAQTAGHSTQDGNPYATTTAYFENTNMSRNTLVSNAAASDCQVHGSQSLPPGSNFLNNMPESVSATLPISEGFNNSQDINNGIVSCQPFQPVDDQNFLSFNADFQRGLHTPIFGNTPQKEYEYHTQEQQSGHVNMNDPVLIETAGKRRKITAGVSEFMSDESSRDTTGSGDLDGIHVLSPVLGMKRSPQILHAAVRDNHSTSSAVGMDYGCPFTGENLALQVRDAMANVGVLGEDSIP